MNVDTVYRELEGNRAHRDPLELFAKMSRFEAEAAIRADDEPGARAVSQRKKSPRRENPRRRRK